MKFFEFEEKIGSPFKDKSLLRQAFTHRSYLNENRHLKLEHNERLEFLGDAVLELAVTQYLFERYPVKSEGELTAVRAAVVNTTSLSETAARLDMNKYLLLSKGESKDVGRARQFILANTFEAVVGALYIDRGYEISKAFITKELLWNTDEIVNKQLWRDPKSAFQEKAQEHHNVTPTYETLKEEGPDHDKMFTVGVYLGKELVSSGTGASKQEAEQEAASRALEEKGWR